MKVIEVTVLALVTTTFAFWLPLTDGAKCYLKPENVKNLMVQYNCPTGYITPYATLLFNTEGGIIRSLIWANRAQAFGFKVFTIPMIGTFGAYWYFFSAITYRAAVPTGVFLSSILVGFTVGQIYENAVENLFGIDNASLTALPLILGAACMLAANTRLSYSIVVLMLEATGSFTLAIPMILAVFTTKFVADLMTNSLFDREIRDL